MAGIRRSRPQPLAQHYHIDTRRRYEVIRRKEALRQALSGPNGARLFAVGPPVVPVSICVMCCSSFLREGRRVADVIYVIGFDD